MLKFEFVVTGMELTDAQKERISAEFPALVTRAIAHDRSEDASRFWCMCKVDGRSTVAHELSLGSAAHELVGSGAALNGDDTADRPDVLVFDLV